MVNSEILVTVITCVYNTPIEYLKEAVKSILNQTHTNFEYFIVDDCSDTNLYSDDLFKDKRITVIRLEENCGPAVARNLALDRAKGKYIAIMDSDDISLPKRFEKQIEFLENNEDVVVCGTWFTYFGDKTHEVKRFIDDNEYYRCCLLFGNAPTLLNPSVMIRRSVIEEHGILYDVRLRKSEDYKMWVQLSMIGRCTNMHENLMNYRVHSNQTSQILKTKDVSKYDWIVMKEQYDKIGIVFTSEEEKIIKKDFRSVEVDSYDYLLILNKILCANEKSGFFVQEKLQKRVDEQWEQKIYNTPLKKVFATMKKLSHKEKRKIMNIELKRVLKKLQKRGN
ncbi:glycosyltransferase family 2 protein [bacterium]|nr:glycosyltransferase family 2 protein [bacterium]